MPLLLYTLTQLLFNWDIFLVVNQEMLKSVYSVEFRMVLSLYKTDLSWPLVFSVEDILMLS